MIIGHLHGNDKVCCLPGSSQHPLAGGWAHQVCMTLQSHLALCCKATLPILCMGHVRVRINKQKRERAWSSLRQAACCLTKQPGGVSLLEVSSSTVYVGNEYLNAYPLVDLSCASALVCLPLLCCAIALIAHRTGTDAMLLCASAA